MSAVNRMLGNTGGVGGVVRADGVRVGSKLTDDLRKFNIGKMGMQTAPGAVSSAVQPGQSVFQGPTGANGYGDRQLVAGYDSSTTPGWSAPVTASPQGNAGGNSSAAMSGLPASPGAPMAQSGPQGGMGDSMDSLGNYDSYIDRSFNHAMRTLRPQINQNEDRFDQRMIDRGLSPGGEAYGQSFDNNSRRYNDLMNAAAFNAMGFGANRLDSDRGYGLSRDAFDASRTDADRNFDLNELTTIDSMNRAWDGIGFRNANFNTSREDQRFNQMLSLFGMTPAGSQVPFNAGAAVGNSVNADLNALQQRQNAYGGAARGIGDAIAGTDWSKIFGMFGSGGNSGDDGTAIDGSNIDALLNGWLS